MGLARVARPAAGALFLALVLLSTVALASEAPQISEYGSELPSNVAPLSIVQGPEGSLWFTQTGGEKAIDRMSPSGALTLYRPGGSSTLRDITLGREGELWFTADGSTGQIGKLDPATGVFREYSLPAHNTEASGIAVGREGDIWVTVEGPEALLVRVVPPTGEVSEFKIPQASSKPAQITAGPEGDLWFTESNNPGAIESFNPNTNAFSAHTTGLTANSSPTGITTGSEGDIWFTEATNPGKIGEISPTSGEIKEFSSGLTVGDPQQIVAGTGGNLYFTESNGNGAIGEITPTGQISEYIAGLSSKAEPWGIASGAEGNIWFTERAAPARIGKLTIRASAPAPSGNPSGGGTRATDPAPGAVTPSGTPNAQASNSTATPQPTLGRTATVSPIKGTIRVETSPTGSWVRLKRATSVPIGAAIDSSHGVLRLTTALGESGKTQSATVWSGVFRVDQSSSGNGMTELRLNGEPLICHPTKGAHASSVKARRVKVRKLWAEDNHGRYTSYGAYSATTVLGTKWETLDTCTGTLTRVARGKVSVHNLVRGVTVQVTAGHSYFARA